MFRSGLFLRTLVVGSAQASVAQRIPATVAARRRKERATRGARRRRPSHGRFATRAARHAHRASGRLGPNTICWRNRRGTAEVGVRVTEHRQLPHGRAVGPRRDGGNRLGVLLIRMSNASDTALVGLHFSPLPNATVADTERTLWLAPFAWRALPMGVSSSRHGRSSLLLFAEDDHR